MLTLKKQKKKKYRDLEIFKKRKKCAHTHYERIVARIHHRHANVEDQKFTKSRHKLSECVFHLYTYCLCITIIIKKKKHSGNCWMCTYESKIFSTFLYS